MCLGIPMEVRSIEGFTAHCETRGIERDVSLFLIQDDSVQPGDHVLVHVGYAIQKLEPEDAEATWAALDEFLEADEREELGMRPESPPDPQPGERVTGE